jgi:hypothetical protein
VNYYWVYPWPVEIVNEESVWTWLGPVLTFCGSVLLQHTDVDPAVPWCDNCSMVSQRDTD